MENKIELEAIFQHANEGILVVGEDGKIGQINPSAEKIFGYRKEELLGIKMEKLLPKRFSKIHESHRKEFDKHPRSRSIIMGHDLELTGLRKNGTEFPVEVSLSPYSNSKGKFVIAFIVDITIRKQAEAIIRERTEEMIERKDASLNRINKELENFTFISSHHLQEPLRKIMIYVDTLIEKGGKDLPQDCRYYLERTSKNALASEINLE